MLNCAVYAECLCCLWQQLCWWLCSSRCLITEPAGPLQGTTWQHRQFSFLSTLSFSSSSFSSSSFWSTLTSSSSSSNHFLVVISAVGLHQNLQTYLSMKKHLKMQLWCLSRFAPTPSPNTNSSSGPHIKPLHILVPRSPSRVPPFIRRPLLLFKWNPLHPPHPLVEGEEPSRCIEWEAPSLVRDQITRLRGQPSLASPHRGFSREAGFFSEREEAF